MDRYNRIVNCESALSLVNNKIKLLQRHDYEIDTVSMRVLLEFRQELKELEDKEHLAFMLVQDKNYLKHKITLITKEIRIMDAFGAFNKRKNNEEN